MSQCTARFCSVVGLIGLALASSAVQAQVTFTNYNVRFNLVEVYNDRIGNSRFFTGSNTDRVRISAFTGPSLDSDAFEVDSGGQLFRSTNGAFTSVSVTHPNFGSLANPQALVFVGLTSGFGGGRNEFTTSFNRASPLITPLLADWDAVPFSVTATNPLSPNGITSVTMAAPDFEANAMPDFVTDLRVTGAGLNPRLDWAIPGTTVPSNVTLQIRRIDEESADGSRITKATFVHGKSLPADATSYTIDEPFSVYASGVSGFPAGLEIGKKYEISVQVELRTGGSLNGRSRTLFEFSPLSDSTANVAVYLPSVGTDGVYKFNIAVNSTDTVVIDPAVAIGYIYETGTGDPNFRNVALPNVGDGHFTIDVFDPALGDYRPGIAAVAGNTYDFTSLGHPLGVSKFRVKGIEASAGLDSTNVTAFMTTVGFMGAGRFTGTMTPIIDYSTSSLFSPVNVPPTVTTTRVGSTLPLKWTLADKQGLAVTDLTAVGSIGYKPTSCAAFTADSAGATPAAAAGNSRLRFDNVARQYVFNWATPAVAGCYSLFVTLDTQQVLKADVMLSN